MHDKTTIPSMALFVVTTLLLGACSATVTTKNTLDAPIEKRDAAQTDQLKTAKRAAEQMILAAYHQRLIDFAEHQRPLAVGIRVRPSNLPQESKLTEFLYMEIVGSLTAQFRIKIVEAKDDKIEGLLEMHVIDSSDSGASKTGIELLLVLIDAPTNATLDASARPVDAVIQHPEYVAFKANPQPLVKQKSASAHLIVEAVNVGTSFDDLHKDKVTVRTSSRNRKSEGASASSQASNRTRGYYEEHGGGSTGSRHQSTETTYVNRGVSGWYPLEQQVTINGKSFRIKGDDTFFDGDIEPGLLNIVVSFREGFWDATVGQQRTGKRHTRQLSLEVIEGDFAHIGIQFICNDTDRDIIITRQ